MFGCGVGYVDTLAHYMRCERVHDMCSRAMFVDGRHMAAVEAEASAKAEGARRVVLTTRAYHRTRASWMASGFKRQCCDTNAWVRAAPLIFRMLGTIPRAGPRAGATNRRPPVRGGARAGVG